MQHHPTRESSLLAAILKKNPAFGSNAYVLEKIHQPNAPGPGPVQTAMASRIER